MGSDKLDKPHRWKRDDSDAHAAKHFAYSETSHKDAAALKSQYRAEVKSIYDAYVLLSEEATSAPEASRAFQTLVAACQGQYPLLNFLDFIHHLLYETAQAPIC